MPPPGTVCHHLTLLLDGEFMEYVYPVIHGAYHTRMVLTFAPLPVPAANVGGSDCDAGFHFEPGLR